jgi:hypothetical protein
LPVFDAPPVAPQDLSTLPIFDAPAEVPLTPMQKLTDALGPLPSPADVLKNVNAARSVAGAIAAIMGAGAATPPGATPTRPAAVPTATPPYAPPSPYSPAGSGVIDTAPQISQSLSQLTPLLVAGALILKALIQGS